MGDLFDITTVKSFDEGKLDLVEEKTEKYIEFVGRTRNNNGIKGYVKHLLIEPNKKNVISISQIGTIVAQIRKNSWYASQNIFSLTTKDNQDKLIGLFTLSAINLALSGNFSDGYSNYPTLKKLEKLEISLPIKNGEIDFAFMERFIAELDAERLAELENYLQVTGLKDYALTSEEKEILEKFESGNFEWREFTFENIFNTIKQGRRLKKDDQIPGSIPFVMAGITNTGITNYISNPVASFPKNSITIDIFGNTFYRNYHFGAGDDTGVYWDTKKDYSQKQMLFFTTSMGKSLVGRFSYGTKLRSSKSFKFQIQLPTKDNKPDYQTMETFISAIQKLVIKDVVLFTDKKLKATREVIATKK